MSTSARTVNGQVIKQTYLLPCHYGLTFSITYRTHETREVQIIQWSFLSKEWLQKWGESFVIKAEGFDFLFSMKRLASWHCHLSLSISIFSVRENQKFVPVKTWNRQNLNVQGKFKLTFSGQHFQCQPVQHFLGHRGPFSLCLRTFQTTSLISMIGLQVSTGYGSSPSLLLRLFMSIIIFIWTEKGSIRNRSTKFWPMQKNP